MFIEINGSREVEVTEDFLVVKDKTLFNNKTKQREGLDGDIVTFNRTSGPHQVWCRGTVDGYTCGNRIKLRGVEKIYDDVFNIKFEHLSTITKLESIDFEEQELLLAEGE